jgi:ribosomal protein L40E
MSDQGLEGPKSESQICPTCGTRNTGETTRCVVCGTELRPQDSPVSPSRTRQITISLPLALVILLVLSAISVGATYALTRNAAGAVQPTATPTFMATPTDTATLEPTLTPTVAPTFTPLPPIEYTIAEGDSCVALAVFYDVSVRSIIELNNLGVDFCCRLGQPS